MTHQEAIRAELVAAPTVTTLVGTRIYPSKAPQGVVAPFVVITTVSSVPQNAMGELANTRLRVARVQIDCYAKGYVDVHAVADAIDNVVANLAREDLTAVQDTSSDLYDDETELRRVSTDYFVAR